MEQEIQKKLEALEGKVDEIFKSVEKTRRYFLIIMWVTVLAIVVPLIGLMFAIPQFLNTYNSALNGLI